MSESRVLYRGPLNTCATTLCAGGHRRAIAAQMAVCLSTAFALFCSMARKRSIERVVTTWPQWLGRKR